MVVAAAFSAKLVGILAQISVDQHHIFGAMLLVFSVTMATMVGGGFGVFVHPELSLNGSE